VAREGRLNPRIVTYLGAALIATGVVLLAVAWSLVAGKSEVALQVPYVLSAGFPGAGLVVVGVGLLVIGVRETDAKVRRQQQQELIGLLAVLREDLAAPPVPPATPKRRTRKAGG
jgi:hypothetical protein